MEGKTQILCALRKATYNRHSLKGLNKPPGVEMQRYASPSSARGSPLYCCLTVQLRGLSVAGATAPCRTVVWHDICPLSWQVRCMPQAALKHCKNCRVIKAPRCARADRWPHLPFTAILSVNHTS